MATNGCVGMLHFLIAIVLLYPLGCDHYIQYENELKNYD